MTVVDRGDPGEPVGGEAAYLLVTDPRMPTGGHAQSGGLEHAVACGRIKDADGLRSFLDGRLATTGLVDAALSAAAHGCGGDRDPSALDAEAAARCPGPALRSVSRLHGRRLLRLGRATWDHPRLRTLEGVAGGSPMWPLAWGVLASVAGLDLRRAAVAAALTSVTTPAWAAVRLIGVDPYAVAAMLAALAPSVDHTAQQALEATRDRPWADLPANSPPLLDLGAEDHARWEARLFAS